jgi:predicted metal-dependent hydrolase
VIEQLLRARRLASLRVPERRRAGQVMLRGEFVPVRLNRLPRWRAASRVALQDGCITITCAQVTSTPAQRSLENWMRKQAREAIASQVEKLAKRLGRVPRGIYVMNQRTKWGNCSSMGNLSFNWRLIMAPEYVLRYIVTHEMVHLAVPDHSPKFWLTVQSHCPETERARQWLVSNGRKLTADLEAC